MGSGFLRKKPRCRGRGVVEYLRTGDFNKKDYNLSAASASDSLNPRNSGRKSNFPKQVNKRESKGEGGDP